MQYTFAGRLTNYWRCDLAGLGKLRRWFSARLDAMLGQIEPQAPSPRTLRVFLVRTGKYQVSDLPSYQWPLADEGREDARAAAVRIAERLGGTTLGLAVLNGRYADLSYRQTTEIIAQHLGVQVVTVSEQIMQSPGTYEIEEHAKRGDVLVMVVNGTALTSDLYRYGGSRDNIGILGPPHGSVHEMVISYVPSTVLNGVQELSRQFVV